MQHHSIGLALPILLASIAAMLAAAPVDPPAAKEGTATPRILVFTRTMGFRHDSIPDGVAAVKRIGEGRYEVDATEDPLVFSDENLARYAAVVFLSTTGEVLEKPQQEAFERYIRGGGGFAGVHAAADTAYEWPFYGALVGAYFKGHPAIQPAEIDVEDRTHPSTRMLPERWSRTDEWYTYRDNPRGRVHVLMTLDETTYEGGGMGDDHPIAWTTTAKTTPTVGKGRGWYTGGGHTKESFIEPLFEQHLRGGILWAAGLAPTAESKPGTQVEPSPSAP
jgi:type 1 glutamine amidotransferase